MSDDVEVGDNTVEVDDDNEGEMNNDQELVKVYTNCIHFNFWLFTTSSQTKGYIIRQPVYETPPNTYLAEQILRILLDPNIDPQKICQGIPTDVTRSATYVIDLASLKHPDDIKKDLDL